MPTLMPGHAPLKFHPLANLFPMLSEAELNDLGEDIKANGQAETVKLHRGMILDGRNRYTACGKFNLAVRTENFEGDDRAALNWVISKNLKRRHLDSSQRAMIAARITTLRLGDNQHLGKGVEISTPSFLDDHASPQDEIAPAPVAPISAGRAAEMMNVDRATVFSAKKVQDEGAPELQRAVDSGKVAVSTAAVLTDLPKEQQREIVQLSEREILAKAKEIRKEQNTSRRAERVEKLKKQAEAVTPLATAKRFPVIYFDPATRFEAGDSNRSTENHYITMREEDIAALPIADLATDDAVLFMWTTVPWLAKSIRLIEGWGFEYKSAAFWDKVDIGLGFWWRDQVEVLLTATRGKMVAPEHGSILGPNLYSEKKTGHSAKPKYFRDRIGAVPEYRELPKVELFARVEGEMPEGWFAWGAEAHVPEQQSLGIDGEEQAA